MPDLPAIQPYVFLTPGENNTVEACTGSFDLEGWKLSVDPNSEVTDVPTNSPDNSTVFNVPTEAATEPTSTGPYGI